jgi:thiol-disulfide isomerase/thioredoxin
MEKSRWMSAVLVAAGVYNLIWGSWVVFFPGSLFQFFEMEPVNHAVVWQALGMVVGVYGVGYLIASRNPLQHWPIVLVGLLGKFFGPIGFLYAWRSGQLPLHFGLVNVFNDLIWLIPFAMILYQAFRWHSDRGRAELVPGLQDLLRQSRSHRGHSIDALSHEKPTMVVFLRHSGCTFCRRVMADLSDVRAELDAMPIHVVVVHMGSPMDGTTILAKYKVEYWHHISDPFCVIYRGFGLQRGRFSQLFSWKVLCRGVLHGLFGGHGMGKLEGDSFFLPGVFVVSRGQVAFGQPAEDAAQRPDFVSIAKRAVEIGRAPATAYNSQPHHSQQSCSLETV